MIKKTAILALATALALQGCATMSAPDATTTTKMAPLAEATLLDGTGRNVGIAQITQSGSTLYLNATVSGQTSGEHGLHFHTVGKCDAPGFTTAAGHLNPTAHMHGSMNPAGPHLGDLPNITVTADGSGTLKAPLSVAPADLATSMFDADGTAIVLHAGPDDYKTDPSGNSGGRIACGVLEKLPR